MPIKFNDLEIRKDYGLDEGRMISAPVFDSVTGKIRDTYEIPLEDLRFIFQYTYDSEIPYWNNEDKCSLALLRIKRGGFWGTIRRELKQFDAKSEPITTDEIKIYATADFKTFFNKFVPVLEREMIWEIMKQAGRAIREADAK